MTEQNVRMIQYVGAKTTKIDRDTGIIWNGPGDVVAVPEGIVSRLLQHPDVWRDVSEGVEATGIKPRSEVVLLPGERCDQIRAVVEQLAPDNSDHFTKGGSPRVEVIEDMLGYEISGQERDDAWDVITQVRLTESHGDGVNAVNPPIDG